MPNTAQKDQELVAGRFGPLVRHHRQQLGISITDLARAAQMDQGLLSKIERGLRPPPQIVPHIQRMAERFGFEPASPEYRELLETAYAERFGANRTDTKRRQVLIELSPITNPPRALGLSGLPPELTAPDSPAGQYYRSQGIKVGQADNRKPATLSRFPEGAARPFAGPNFFNWSQLIDLLTSAGMELVSFQQDDNDGKGPLRIRAVLRPPDGGNFELELSLQRQKERKDQKKKQSRGRSRTRRAPSKTPR
ncbi:MAG: helix-turn-helix transcriptional regulator [Acidobacteriia bacterium]|nr:helix-turn-helix transcriptional regulator [Terriglobia bacterium]